MDFNRSNKMNKAEQISLQSKRFKFQYTTEIIITLQENK